MTIVTWLESTIVARAVGESLFLTAWLSATHILAFTLVMGSALLSNLRLLNLVLPQAALAEVARPTTCGILVGLPVSLFTGVLLFSARASSVIGGSTFQTKMTLLVAAVAFFFLVQRRVTLMPEPGVILARVTGAVGLLLWMGLAATACWFILFE